MDVTPLRREYANYANYKNGLLFENKWFQGNAGGPDRTSLDKLPKLGLKKHMLVCWKSEGHTHQIKWTILLLAFESRKKFS